jgi:hypothetical protein
MFDCIISKFILAYNAYLFIPFIMYIIFLEFGNTKFINNKLRQAFQLNINI